jgi:hypothetical protein
VKFKVVAMAHSFVVESNLVPGWVADIRHILALLVGTAEQHYRPPQLIYMLVVGLVFSDQYTRFVLWVRYFM